MSTNVTHRELRPRTGSGAVSNGTDAADGEHREQYRGDELHWLDCFACTRTSGEMGEEKGTLDMAKSML